MQNVISYFSFGFRGKLKCIHHDNNVTKTLKSMFKIHAKEFGVKLKLNYDDNVTKLYILSVLKHLIVMQNIISYLN